MGCLGRIGDFVSADWRDFYSHVRRSITGDMAVEITAPGLLVPDVVRDCGGFAGLWRGEISWVG